MLPRARAVVAAVAVVALLTACSDSKPSSTSSTSIAPPTSVSSSAAPTPTTFTPALAGTGNVFFLSPSKNIGCSLSETGARCDIRERDWTPPPAPASCDVDFGQGVQVVGTSPGMLVCAGDTAIVGEAVLQYGTFVTRSHFECRSEKAAMRCRNLQTNHGFSLSRERYTLE